MEFCWIAATLPCGDDSGEPRTPVDGEFFLVHVRWILILTVLFILPGCDGDPSAPELRDAPVYRSASEGFRFLVPDGWTQIANASLPSGELDKEVFLTRYRVRSPEMGAMLYVICFNDDESLDLQQYHSGASFRAQGWEVVSPMEEVKINESTGHRGLFKTTIDQNEMSKDVLCFRKNGRVYSFVGLYWSIDEKAQQQLNRAVESIIWD